MFLFLRGLTSTEQILTAFAVIELKNGSPVCRALQGLLPLKLLFPFQILCSRTSSDLQEHSLKTDDWAPPQIYESEFLGVDLNLGIDIFRSILLVILVSSQV